MVSKILIKYLKALRIGEVSLMTGFFIIGFFFSISSLDKESFFKFPVFVLTSYFLIFSIYCYNAGAGSKKDKNNIRLKNLKTIGGNTFYILSFIFLSISLFLGLFFSKVFLVLTLIIFVIWIIYSHPLFGLKHRAVWGTILHFISQIFHFNLGFSVFKTPCLYSLFVSIIFAISFSVGHLLHEIIDYNSDKESGSKTTAVVFGIKYSGILALVLTIINLLFLLLIFYYNVINNLVFVSFAFPLLSHTILFSFFLNDLKSKAKMIRSVHRITFFLGGLVYIILKLYNLV